MESSDQPRTGAKAQAERAARQAREATALRDNLRRRKEQARARAEPADAPSGAKGDAPCR